METGNHEVSKRRRMLGGSLIVLTSLALTAAGCVKFAHIPKVVNDLGAMGFTGDRLTLVATLEVTGAVLFLVRPTRALGLLLLSAFLGGAIATHVGHGEWGRQPAIVLVLIWLGAWLRHPVVLWSLDAGIGEPAALAPPEHHEIERARQRA